MISTFFYAKPIYIISVFCDIDRQLKLFESEDQPKKIKSYRAIRHDVIRTKQKINDNSVHHPIDKVNQIIRVLNSESVGKLSILELYAGHGNLTKIYAEFGNVTANELKKQYSIN